MVRMLSVCAVLVALASAARTGEKTKAGEQPPPPFREIIRLTVQPATAPKPALKYQLLPELREMNPGNPILGYLRCFSEQNHFFHSKEANDQREKWLETPLKDLPVKEMRGYGGIALRLADYAARLDTPDWQILPRLKSEGIGLLVPDVQQMRSLTNALQVRFRGEVADRRFDDALRTAQTMFALARHMGKHPTLIGNLVGIAIAQITIAQLDEMFQQPGCPNLFWALTDLPQLFIDLRDGVQGDRLMLAREFGLLNEKAPMTELELKKAKAEFHKLFQMIGPIRKKSKEKSEEVQAWLDRSKNKADVRAARRRLVEFGLSERPVKDFPPLQVVLLDLKYTFEEERDEATKALPLPYWQAEPYLVKLSGKRAEKNLLSQLASAILKVRGAQARLEQRFALVRHVEALRLYAATHQGQLPKQLNDMKLPLPVDPLTGRPFRYLLDGGTATLEGRVLDNYGYRYVITVAK